MVLATVLFAFMGVCVKLASTHFGTAAVVSARGLVGAVMMGLIAWRAGTALHTRMPMMHLKRGLAGVLALTLWFYCIGQLPLATAVTLNYMSSVWMAAYLLIGSALFGGHRVDRRLVGAIIVGFIGVGLVLHPTIERDQVFAGLLGIGSGMLAAMAYVQVTALGRAGEPEVRVVFYFSLTGTVLGALIWLVPGQTNPTPLPAIPLGAWAALIGVGGFATIAQLLMTRAYATGRMLVNANLQYLGIVHASLLGMLVFDERLTPDGLMGMALIVGAGVVSTRLKSSAGEAPVRDSQGKERSHQEEPGR
jgi:drug/metabolite transporter (DMT)-like permease